MFTSLDLLIIVVMLLGVLAIISLVMMFLLKNKKAQKGFFYAGIALSSYLAYVGIRMGITGLTLQLVLGILGLLIVFGSILMLILSKNNNKLFLVARIMATVALTFGMFNILI